MKKYFFILLIFLCKFSFAGDFKLSKAEEQNISQSFKQLDQLESFVNTHEGITYSEIKNKNFIPKNFQYNISGIADDEKKKKWYEDIYFYAGFCLGIYGILIALVLAKKKEEKLDAVYGCLAFSALEITLLLAIANGQSISHFSKWLLGPNSCL